ncbi:MAG: thioredoxin [Oscillospiraceae bacterium]|nr:thioredoxin [Oscillospiraceae bacterium]
MSIAKISEMDFEESVLNGELPVIADFYAEWCPPCKMLAPVLEEAAAELEGVAEIVKINVDESPQLAAEYDISTVPTLLFFKDGIIEQRHSGFITKDDLIEMVG